MICDFYGETTQYQENLLVKYYCKLGHHVVIITSIFTSIVDYYSNNFDKKNQKSIIIAEQSKIIRLPYLYNIKNRIRKFPKVLDILKKEKPDLIFIHGEFHNLKEAVAFKKLHPDCKIIIDYHANYSNSGKDWLSLNILHKTIRKFVLNRSIKSIDKIFAIVPESTIFLNEVYNIPENRIELLPLGSDRDFAKEILLSNHRLEIRNQYNIPENGIVIFTGGKLTPEKNTHLLIQAINKISNTNLHLFIVGDATEEKYKNRLVEEIGQNNKIYLTGWVKGDETYKYMTACDFAIFPSSPSVLWQQCIGMELPLIVGDCIFRNTGKIEHVTQDYLNKNNNLIILNRNEINADTIAEKILLLMHNPKLLEKMREGAINTAEEFLSYEAIAKRTLNF